ncbi:cytochrome c [Rhodoplanes sp. TEM]|uniref:Cytochrome c n=1 Tax=Rhodoplanes tepidamans TaxID=200616 RepID=A0ABT5J6X6_RHOTP|nr:MULTISPECIES: cytochrome c [Rhodoplanes]MDC7785136.1 cytochrome c [Rhodoplanes tepidamans]MDC7982610.1 cytochrome c [Rhodoplanes sp. TEM]MDQ0356626.1 mono/diheme cytochrome c family protein [Rhodoplanes tepidamans]
MRFLKVVLALFVLAGLGFGGFLVFAHRPAIEAAAAPRPDWFDDALVARGAELAAIGNCSSCHTVEGGPALAGGRALRTPFGTIYGTNITPDPDTGIGRWPKEAFARAMRDGVDRAGEHLYPAFPYDHFTRLTDRDIDALYAYLMTRTPVHDTAPANDLPFPLGFRPLLAGWKLLFFRPGRFEPDASATAEVNHGAYLVESLAHCGACHTPRNALGAEETERRFAGGTSDGWIAPALTTRNPAPVPWTAEALARYLKQGFDRHHGAASGPMIEVARNLSRVPDQDVAAMARYVAQSVGEPSRERAEAARSLLAELAEPGPASTTGTAGAAAPGRDPIYAGACGGCHDAAREIVHALPLSLVTAARLDSPANLLRAVLEGVHPRDRTAGPLMPGFDGALTDEQIVQVTQHVRTAIAGEPAWDDVAGMLRRIRTGDASDSGGDAR